MKIEKKPIKLENMYIEMKQFINARTAFANVLHSLKVDDEYTLFLPAYIGYSPKEGSGIFDPVIKEKIAYEFYTFRDKLNIDVPKLMRKIVNTKGKKVVLLVHYFGYVDPSYIEIIDFLKKNDVFVIEDAAHAFFTHQVDLKCGLGDCIFYSFHKMFPMTSGGAIVTKFVKQNWWKRISANEEKYYYGQYMIGDIAKKRKENAHIWECLLKENNKIELIRKENDYFGQTPQTIPILLKRADRFEVYKKLNQQGYGIISLYHTMIAPIQEIDDKNTMGVSDNILNLPVHQDIGQNEIERMYEQFVKAI